MSQIQGYISTVCCSSCISRLLAYQTTRSPRRSRTPGKVKKSQESQEVSARSRSPSKVRSRSFRKVEKSKECEKFRQGKEFPTKWPRMNNFEEVYPQNEC